jgi:hypothetical protein
MVVLSCWPSIAVLSMCYRQRGTLVRIQIARSRSIGELPVLILAKKGNSHGGQRIGLADFQPLLEGVVDLDLAVTSHDKHSAGPILVVSMLLARDSRRGPGLTSHREVDPFRQSQPQHFFLASPCTLSVPPQSPSSSSPCLLSSLSPAPSAHSRHINPPATGLS